MRRKRYLKQFPEMVNHHPTVIKNHLVKSQPLLWYIPQLIFIYSLSTQNFLCPVKHLDYFPFQTRANYEYAVCNLKY